MKMLRRTLPSETIEPLVDLCFKKYPKGLVSRVQKGKVPSQYQAQWHGSCDETSFGPHRMSRSA
jgi:hypothetical protein